MNTHQPDDQEEQIDIDEGMQPSEDPNQSSEDATQVSTGTNRAASNPNIINK